MLVNKEDWPSLVVGIMATLAGIGLARFAFSPLLPALVELAWFSESQVVYLGAVNLLGYLLGALSAHWLSQRYVTRIVLRGCFTAIALSFVCCALPGDFRWFFWWRLVAGVAGAILMILGPVVALAATPLNRRPRVGALVFTGIGLGAILSAIVVPTLLQIGLPVTWLTLAGLSAMAAVICECGWSGLTLMPQHSPPPSSLTVDRPRRGAGLVVGLVMAAYALDGVGFVPHTVFWVDYLSREQWLGTTAASFQWAVFGLGAVCGPLGAGVLTQRLGCGNGLKVGFMVKAIAVALPLLSVEFLPRTLSSFLVGALVPGLVALTSGCIAELVGPAMHTRYWGRATAVFALAQALSGYGMSVFYEISGRYHPLFVVASGALAAGLVLLFISDVIGRVNQAQQSRCFPRSSP